MLKINPQTGETEEISLFDLLDGGVKEIGRAQSAPRSG